MSVIGCLDVFPQEVVNEIKKYWDSPLEPCFAKSYDRKEQMDLAECSDYIVTGVAPVDSEMIETASKLKVIHKWGIGVDKIDLDAAKKCGVRVLITSGLNAIPVAEHAVLLMLAASKRIPYLDKSLRDGEWLKIQPETRSFAYHLSGRRVGIVGFGNIGKRVCHLVKAFGAEVSYYDLFRQPQSVEQELGVTYKDFDKILEESEIITLHTPLTKGNSHLIDANALSKMQKGAILINTARGALVDELALYNSLLDGKLAAAGLDVFNEEPIAEDSLLITLPNVVLTPHVAGATFNNVKITAVHIRQNLDKILKGEDVFKNDIII